MVWDTKLKKRFGFGLCYYLEWDDWYLGFLLFLLGYSRFLCWGLGLWLRWYLCWRLGCSLSCLWPSTCIRWGYLSLSSRGSYRMFYLLLGSTFYLSLSSWGNCLLTKGWLFTALSLFWECSDCSLSILIGSFTRLLMALGVGFSSYFFIGILSLILICSPWGLLLLILGF